MRKILSLVMALVMCASLLAGCGKKSEGYTGTVRLGGLKGPTSMGMVKLLDDNENGISTNKYDFTMAASADELTPKLMNGEIDIVAVPANLASILYANTDGGVRVAAVNTLGVLYILEKGGSTVNSVSDLKGKTIFATGKGTTPEYSLKYLLTASGLDAENDVTIEWKSEPTEVVAQISSMDSAVAMMPQPFVTVAQSKIDDLRIAVNLSEAWDSLGGGSRLVTAVLLVRSGFADEHPDAVRTFFEEYRASSDYANTNTAEAAVLVGKYGIVDAAVAEKAIPFCNIVCITGKDMKEALGGYLEILFGQNPKAVGGKLPGDDFYLIYE